MRLKIPNSMDIFRLDERKVVLIKLCMIFVKCEVCLISMLAYNRNA